MRKTACYFIVLSLIIVFCGCKNLHTIEESFYSDTVISEGKTVIITEKSIKSGEENLSFLTETSSKTYPSKNTVTVQIPETESAGIKEITRLDIDKIIQELNKQEGMEFTDLSDAKNTDTVTMNNLYLLNNEPMNGEFNSIDTEVMNALNNNECEYVELGKIGFDMARKYASAFYFRRYYEVCVLSDDPQNPDKANYFISIPETLNNQKVFMKKDYYINMQNVIKSLGIKKGMLQKDAILKFNEYICAQVDYDGEGMTKSLDGFFAGKAICNSYAQVFEILCRTVGINCEFIGGTAMTPQGTQESHAWNRITFSDGTVYYFDTCWNDSYITINTNNYQRTERYMFISAFTNRVESEISVVGYCEF